MTRDFESRERGREVGYARPFRAVERAPEPTAAERASDRIVHFARDVGAVAGALDAVRAANDASDPARWEAAHGALERHLAAAERSLERARGAAVEADPATRQRLADAERELASHREAATRFVGPPRGWKPVAREAEILAVLGAPVHGPARDGFARKEARLAQELEELSLADSRILRGRITKASAGDPIAEKLATFTPERRARIVELLDGARRRDALRAARGPGKLPDAVRGDLEAATGRSLGHVRVHDDDEGHATAAQHGVRAVAIGSEIHMGDGELDATSPGGRALLAHEVAHVVQADAQPGPPTPAAKRDTSSTDAAEVEADAFAERFVQHGAGATFRPTAAVGARTPMRAPAVAAAPRPAAPAPAAAATYFAQHQAQFFDAIRTRLAALSLPPPHARLVWAGASDALAAAFEPAMIATRGSGMDLALALPELVYPADPWQAIDLHRDAAAGLAAWSPVAGQALALAFESVLRTSLPRMGLRYVALADDYDGHVTPELLVASHPFDRVAARLICDPAIAHYVRSQAPRGRRSAPADTDAPTAFKNGLRLVAVNWLTGSLWNYVEVTSPPDATLEEVSATLFERGDGTNHTEYAYGLVAVGRYVRIPRKWARQLSGVIDQDLHDEDDGKGELALADSDLADAEAGAEAGAARKPGDPGALAKTFGQTRADLTLAADLLGAWGLADLLGPARRWVDKHTAKLAKAAPETLGTWAAIAQAQRGVLHDALSDLTDVTSVAANAHVQPGSDASPIRDVLEAIAIAMGESHLAKTAAAQLAKAHQQKALLSLNLLDASLHANREAAQEFAATPSWSPSAGADDPGEQRAAALSTASTLEAGALAMRGKVIAGGAIDADDLDAQSIATAESTLRNRLRTLQDQLGKLEDAAGSAIEGFAGTMGNARNDAIHALRQRLPDLNNRATQILVQMGKDAVPSPIPSDPAAGRAAFAAARKRAVTTAEASFKQFAQDADLRHLFQNALDAIQHAQRNAAIAQMIVDAAALIGISLVGGAVGTAIGGFVRGAVLAEAATDTAAFARGATVARMAGAAANIVTDAGVTAIGQTALQGGSAKRSFVENVMINAMTIGALRPIHTLTGEIGQLDKDALGMWKVVSHGNVVLAHGASLTVEMLVAAGASYVAARVVEGAPPPNEATAVSWAVQGASIAVGKWIGVKTQELHDRWSRFGEERVQLLRRAAVQEQLARQVAQSGNGEQALALLEEHARLLHDEATLLADPKATARLGLDAAQVDALRAGNQAALADTQSQAYQTMKLRYHGLEPEAANGSVWSGTHAQIEAVLAEAGAGQAPTAAGRWDVELDGRRVTLLEVDEGVSAAPDTRISEQASERGKKPATPVKDPGLQLANIVGDATYEGGGVFRIATSRGAMLVEVRRTGAAEPRVRRTDDHVVLEVPKGTSPVEFERVVVGKLTELRYEEMRRARGEQATAESGLGAHGTGERLSPADMGKIAELRVLRVREAEQRAQGAGGQAAAAELKAQREVLERELGLDGDSPDAVQRRRAVEVQIEVQGDAARRERTRRELDGDRGHPGIELHNHFMGIVDAEVFRERAAVAENGKDTGQWGPLLERIAALNGAEFRHGYGPDKAITRRATAGDAVKIARESLKQYETLLRRADEQESGISADDRAQIRRSAEAVAEEACRTALAATPETDFNSAYEIRDALIKQTFGGPVKPGESADVAQQRAYDDYIREAVLQLAHDGVGYSEQSSSLKKLAGKITPERVEAVVDQLIAEGKLVPGQVDIRMLGMTITGHFGERDPRLPPVRTGERSSDEAYGRDVAATARAIGHPGTVGSDVGGPELYTFDATGKARFMEMYRALLGEAKRTGSPAVFRPHVGEGAVDNHEGKPFHTDKDRHVRGGEPSHYARARANIDAMLDTLAQLKAEGALDPAKVIVRLGHVTHATPDQAARMRSLGVIAEVNLGSNVATAAVSQTVGVDGPRSPVERFDDHSFPTLLYYDAPIAISTDAGAVMSTTLRAEYQRAHQIIEEVLAGARPIRVRAADATLDKVVRGREVAGHPDERDLTITELTPAERGRFLHAYEKLYADAERYYLRRPKPRGSGRNTTSGASPFAGAHHVAIAANHGLIPSQGTAMYEGVRSDVEAAARAYRAKGYFVGGEMKAGEVVLFTVRSPDGDFETALRSWGGDGPSYIPFAERGATDPPLTNHDVRAWYKQQIARIETLNEGWIIEGVPLEERARRAYEVRKHARLAAREQMSSAGAVASLEVRDLSEYGEPDGPDFEQLVEDNMAKGMTREQALEAIIGSSRRSNAGYDRKHGMGVKQ